MLFNLKSMESKKNDMLNGILSFIIKSTLQSIIMRNLEVHVDFSPNFKIIVIG
jgi:hypothetical protein